MEQLRFYLRNKQVRNALIAVGAVLTITLLILLWPASQSAPSVAETTVAEITQPTVPPRQPNSFRPEDFIMEDGYMTCLTANALLGIDVSGHQGDIDWQAVKQAGIGFVFIRIGGRYAQSGDLYDDSFAPGYYEGAKAAGLLVGAYFFSQAISPEEAREEALYALELTKDWSLDLPIAYDWEEIGDDVRTNNMDAATLTDCMIAFCQTIQQADRQAIIYTNPSYAGVGVELERLNGYDIWLALHSEEMTYPYEIYAWQYTDAGYVPGIAKEVDMNLLFLE